MKDVIQLLPDSVANQIAAGEVIQRPASVVKELVENAIDAGAQTIHVLIVDAGRTSIQVVDDGKGMSETDARLAFERHATSKIRQADDLFALHTMGFRGEALASIAAVAQVELQTRMSDEEIGTRLSLSGSRVVAQEPVACAMGSRFSVENLFFNVPARRKFLKSNSTELNHILTAFERIVLVNPGIGFTLHSNGTELLNLRACGLRQRIVDVFGKKINQDLLSLGVETTVCNISGFVGKPEPARKKGTHQYFFVNGRYMKHPYFHKAVAAAFERLVPAGEQVPYFIYFDVPAEDIDVNIHPTKTEIKFENEQTIWQILAASVKESIGKFNDVPAIDFDTEGCPDIPVFNPSHATSFVPKVHYDPQYNPFKHSSAGQSKVPKEWSRLYGSADGSSLEGETESILPEAMNLFDEEVAVAPNDIAVDKSPVHYQYKGKYIMTAVKSGLMIIDQHRAHVRILYDEYMERLHNQLGNTQRLLFPEIIRFSAVESAVLDHILPTMAHLGFDLSDLGNGSYALNGMPAFVEGLDGVKLVQDMVKETRTSGTSIAEEMHHVLALCLAHHAAIPYGQVLGNEEMENIQNRLFACSNVNYTPDGKTILTIFPQSDIEKKLG